MARQQTQERPATQQQPRQAPAGNLPATQAEPKRVHPLVAFRDYAAERSETLQSALPKHISADVFLSIVMTALQKKPELLKCTKQSLWNACVMAAQDGLLPDGREGAIAPYGQNVDGKRSAEIATWMPMIEGLRKKARNSGEILNWEVHAVRARDHFRFALGDEAFIEHEPYFGSDDPGDVLGVYSIATLKDGIKSRDVMTIRDVKKIEAKSAAKNGPWKDPTFFGEMAKKTVARRHYKQLPHSAALDRLMARDDAEFDLDHQADEQIEQRSQRRLMSTTAAFDRFADSAPTIDHDPQTGEVIDDDFGSADPQDDQAQDQASSQADPKPAAAQAGPKPAKTEQKPAAAAAAKPATEAKRDPISSGVDKPAAQEQAAQPRQEVLPPEGKETQAQPGSEASGDPVDDQPEGDQSVGEETRRWPNGETPSNPDEYEHYAETRIGDFMKPGEIAPWFKSKEEIDLRKACAVPQTMFEAVRGKAQARVAELSKK
jgi:recombination protein RecT